MVCWMFFGWMATAAAQSMSVSGMVQDAKTKEPLIGVNVVLYAPKDTVVLHSTTTDLDGAYWLSAVDTGAYTVEYSYISYKTLRRNITVSDSLILAPVSLEEESKLLKEVVIEDKQIRVQQLGDTSQFNAGAFKTNKDASTEELLVKMPGITSENGTMKVNGEEVKKILVDGKPYFGDDTRTAVQNLPAELIDKIQVFDRMSDQAAFTGFDDGNSEKTINIVTKSGVSDSKIGKFYAGYGGPDNRYNAGITFNAIKNDRRISLLGMSNNINQQNFNIQDLVGAMGSGGGNRGGMGGGGRGGMRGMNNYMVGQQNGIATTTALGLNYTDVLGKKKKVTFTGSYFFNSSLNDNLSTTIRNYISAADSGLVYNENKSVESKNFNNRANFRIEYRIDSMNTLIFTPSLTTQHNNTTSLFDALTSRNNESTLSRTNTEQRIKQLGINFSNDILWQHKLKKQGRTISTNLTTSYNTRKSDGRLYTLNDFAADTLMVTDTIDQQSHLRTKSYTLSGSIVYTEPIRKTGQLSFTYTPSFTRSNSEKNTDNFDILTNEYTLQDTVLTNRFTNTYMTHRLGIAYRYNNKKLSWSVGLNGQDALLRSEQLFPDSVQARKNFLSLLPTAELNYKFSKTSNLRVFYRTSNNPPSISQLQNVVDNSNSLILTSGNPELKQNFTQTIGLRFGRSNPDKATNVFVFANATNTMNYIANATTLFTRDTIIQDIRLNAGAQYIRPVNLNGYWNARTFITYGFPLSKLKSNMNVNAGFTYLRTPTLINDTRNSANSYTFNTGLTLSSNISTKIDFTISYNGSFNLVRNTLQQQNNTNYYNHIASARFNYQFWKGFVFNTSVMNNVNAGGSASFNTSFWLLNASLAYKFLKDESLEVKFSANDILNQNRNISRSVTEIAIEDVRSNALTRYFMGTITYNLRKIKGKETDGTQKNLVLPPPPGGPMPGGHPAF